MRFSVLVLVCVLAACGGSGGGGSDDLNESDYQFVGSGSDVVIDEDGDVFISGTNNDVTVLEMVQIDRFEISGINNQIFLESGASIAELVVSGSNNDVCVTELSQIGVQDFNGSNNQVGLCD